MRQIVLLLLVAIGATSCATIVHGRYQNVAVTSAPAGAHVDVDCGDVPHDGGVTPATVRLRRGADHCVLTVAKSGYATETVTMHRAVSPAVWGNVGAGLVTGLGIGAALTPSSTLSGSNDSSASTGSVVGLLAGAAIPLVVDHSTGAMYKQTPESVNLTLKPQ